MAVYKVTNAASALTAVEFTPVADGNFAFFYAKADADKGQITQWLTGLGQEIVATTAVDGQTVFVTHGDKSQQEITKALTERGDSLELKPEKKEFNWWAGRGALSMAGQLLQLTSAYLAKGGIDGPTATFALCNIAANISNMVFGAEKKEDISRLRFLKSEVNADLAAYIASEDTLPSIDDRRAELRHEGEDSQSLGARAWNAMQRNSVRIGEIGLRYFGSMAMAFPMKPANWKNAFSLLGKGKVKGAYDALKNTDAFTRNVGLAYMGGKTLGFASRVPDPYDDAGQSQLDTFREKYVFRFSTAIETGAASILTWDRFFNRKIKLRGKEYTDYPGTIGGALFVGAFILRFFAPFGVRKLDMEELQAHITDCIAKTPPDKLPQLMADITATLKEKLKDENVEYGELFTKMMTDLYRYHHIALDNLGTRPEERLAKANGHATPPPVAAQGAFTAAHPPRPAAQRVTVPAESHAATARSVEASGTPLGVSA